MRGTNYANAKYCMRLLAKNYDEGKVESSNFVFLVSIVIIVVPSILILYVIGHKYVSSKCCLESLSQIASEAI